MGHPRYSDKEIAERGREWYERKIRFEVGEGNEGKPLIIDIETDEYEIDEDSLAASHRALAKHPGAALYGMRIGYPAMVKIRPGLVRSGRPVGAQVACRRRPCYL